MSDLSCEVIEDMLPLYYDEVCSPDTGNIVKAHILHCEACRDLLNRMGTDINNIPLNTMLENKAEGAGLQRFASLWNRTRAIAFIKGTVVATLICGLFIVSYVGLFKWNTTSVSSDVMSITELSQLKNGDISFHLKLTDGYNTNRVKYTLDQEGNYYFTAKRPVIKSKKFADIGLANMYYTAANANIEGKVKAIYAGTPKDRVLIWEVGTPLPPASEAIEAQYGND